MPRISIIIPCYNSETTLNETLESVFNQDFKDWEAIIINDGSTDSTDTIALQWIKKDFRFRYYSKSNEGLTKSRNFAIGLAKSDYILPLDSDNLIMPEFTNEAIDILDKNKIIGVVHGHALYIGEKSGFWKIGEYKMEEMLLDNYIDACAIYRKNLWEQVGGYDEHLPYEALCDWEFWLAFGAINVHFFHTKKITFKYRVSKNSMIGVFTKEMASITGEYIAKKYSELYRYHYCKYVRENIRLSSKLNNKRFVLNVFCKTFFGLELFKPN